MDLAIFHVEGQVLIGFFLLICGLCCLARSSGCILGLCGLAICSFISISL